MIKDYKKEYRNNKFLYSFIVFGIKMGGKQIMYYDESIKIDFKLPKYLEENIENLIRARKEKRLDIDCEESELLSNINRAMYSKDITENQASILRKKYLWWE